MIVQKEEIFFTWVITLLGFSLISMVLCVTDPSDLKILNEFRKGLENPELLQWPSNDDDPCGSKWKHVFCSGNRVTQIQVQSLGLIGTLPSDFNQLTELSNLGFQRNKFHGKLPTFSGLSNLEYAYLDFNNFDEIPSDFFQGLTNIKVLELDNNPLNKTNGWSLPDDVGKLTQLVNFSTDSCNLVGPIPDIFGSLASLLVLRMSGNSLTGVIPMSLNQTMLQILWLNDQEGEGMSGTIDVITSLPSLTQVWLHGNHFSGPIPEAIGSLGSLKDLNLNGNQLVGMIPKGLASLKLDKLDLNNNMLMGPIPKFVAGNVTYDSNPFCQKIPGAQCAPQVNVLLDFLSGMNYPVDLASKWSGNDPCVGPWLGVSCSPDHNVAVINLPNRNLTGTLSPSLGNLHSLRQVRLGGNHLHGQIPANVTQLKSLTLLDVSGNNFEPPLPEFRSGLKFIIDGNPLLVANHSAKAPAPVADPPPSSSSPPNPLPTPSSPSPPDSSSRGSVASPPPERQHSPSNHSAISSSNKESKKPTKSRRLTFVTVFAAIAASVVLILLLILCYIFCCKKNQGTVEEPCSVVVHPKDPYDPDNVVKVAVVSSNNTGSLFTPTGSSSGSGNSCGKAKNSNSHVFESGNLVISVQVLRNVTNNFSPENQLGRGGFGVVYEGKLEDGTKIAVKRMEAAVINSKQLDEFHSEISVLSKVRHRHLVSLFGYSTEGYEKLLVYEYMPQGALSKHLFHWRELELEPLSWEKRLMIALDVARGMEYLHTLAHQSFIHRDLKSSNILLDDEFRAKVSDFGLVKLAPDRERSVATRLAGTFGYLAPEYAVTGKVSTKVDVFSFGVVLMELLTGLIALDEERSEERRYLAEWFWRIKENRETLKAAIDPTLNSSNEEVFESMCIIAELAGHCTARDPNHRPDMGHVVSVLAPLIDIWKPFDNEVPDCSGIDYNLPLREMLKGWQNETGKSQGNSYTSMDDSRGSIPARPTGFADSFTSADAR